MRERLPATISAPRRPHPPANATIALLGTLFGIAVLANVFAAYFVTQEHYVYFWDYSGYRLLSVDVNALLFHDPADAIRRVIGSIRWSDYNALPVLPLLPFFWLFGESRLTYILAITNAALLPGAVALGIFAHRFLRSRLADRSLTPLLLAITSVLTLHSMWTPVLRGYPDALGVVVIGGILLIHFAKPLAEQRPSYLIGTGLLLCLLVLIRRWYAFWVVAFIPALAAAQALAIYQGRRYLASQYIAAARNAAVIGLTFAAALFILATPFALRALGTDYSDIYSAYRFSNSVWAATQLIPPQFGWIGIFCAASGLALLTLRRETRVVGIFLIVQSGTVFWLFTRTQDFSVQHYYLLMPTIAVGVAVMATWLWDVIANRVWRIMAVGLVLISLLGSSAVVFFPRAAVVAERVSSLVPQVRYYPFNRTDLTALGQLLDRLEQLELDKPGDVYVLASSEILNSSIVQNYCRLGPRPRAFCARVLNTNDIDKRDGFPQQFLDANYLIVAAPTQYTVRAEDQRVVGVLAREVTTGDGVGSSFQRLPWTFRLDNGVKVQLYRKVRTFSAADLDALSKEFAAYYPRLRQKFRVTETTE